MWLVWLLVNLVVEGGGGCWRGRVGVTALLGREEEEGEVVRHRRERRERRVNDAGQVDEWQRDSVDEW